MQNGWYKDRVHVDWLTSWQGSCWLANIETGFMLISWHGDGAYVDWLTWRQGLCWLADMPRLKPQLDVAFTCLSLTPVSQNPLCILLGIISTQTGCYGHNWIQIFILRKMTDKDKTRNWFRVGFCSFGSLTWEAYRELSVLFFCYGVLMFCFGLKTSGHLFCRILLISAISLFSLSIVSCLCVWWWCWINVHSKRPKISPRTWSQILRNSESSVNVKKWSEVWLTGR